jgi:hypothetical protein
MRALCGAIIAAGSLIGLGLLSIGIGTRYNFFSQRVPNTDTLMYVRLKDMDSSLLLCLVFLIVCALIGLGIAFLGLAYHHHHRHHELLRSLPPNNTGSARITV